MIYYNDAKILSALEIKEKIETSDNNPTVDRLLFLEHILEGKNQSKLFPCFVEAWSEDKSAITFPERKDERKWLMFKCVIIQTRGGEFQSKHKIIHEKDLNGQERIWDKPPTKELMRSLLISSRNVQ